MSDTEKADDFQARYDASKASIGTNHYDGVAWFHNHEYRFVLRSPGDYQEFWQLKHAPRGAWWQRKYKAIHDGFLAAGLPTNGFSSEHTAIIGKVLRRPGLVAIYHAV
jgi:hypothetical protein